MKKTFIFSDPNAIATCNSTGDNYPFGTHEWYFINDTCPRAGSQSLVRPNVYKFPISFTACDEEEFTCRDGTW
jgi:hypothetical protein